MADIEKIMKLNIRDHRKIGNVTVNKFYYDKKKEYLQRIDFYLHNTLICSVDPRFKKYTITDGGVDSTLTHKFTTQLIKYFSSKGCKLVGLDISGKYAENFIRHLTEKRYPNPYLKYIVYDGCLYELKLSGKYSSSASVEHFKLLRVLPDELVSLLIMSEIDLFNIPAELLDSIMSIKSHQ